MVNLDYLQERDFIYRDILDRKDVVELASINDGERRFIGYNGQTRHVNPEEWDYIPLSLDLLQTLFNQTPLTIISPNSDGTVRLDLSVTNDNIFLNEGKTPLADERRTFYFITSSVGYLSFAYRLERPAYLHEFQAEMRILLNIHDYDTIFTMRVISDFLNSPLSYT